MAAPSLAQALLAPRSVALIGASADAGKTTARAQRYLRQHGYGGRVRPINPGHDEIQGETAYPSLLALPEPVDHAFIMVAAEAVPGVVAECGELGVPCATILADGFAEGGRAGIALQEEVLVTAKTCGVRLLGPNSMGIINVHERIALTVNAALDTPTLLAGPLGVLSHSGSLLGTLLSRGQARGFGFSKLVSVGNEADICIGELGEILIDDGATEAILLFLETIRQPARLEAMARRAADVGKPVIAYMLGRSEAGRELAASHTGALVGSDEATDAFLRDCGILRVDMLETLFELPSLVMKRRPPGPRPRTVAVMTTTGDGGAMVVDRLALAGIDVVPPPDGVIEGLSEQGIHIGPGRLTDITLAGTQPEIVGAVLKALLASPHCQAVVAVVGSSAQFQTDLAVQPIIAKAGADKPLAVFLAPQADEPLRLLAEAGIAAFRTPEGCAEAVRCLFDWRPPRRAGGPPVGDPARAARLLAGPGGVDACRL
jgi:acyl-CoA synthetase (NDP forming)